MSRAYIIDTETNGREPAEVIELAYKEASLLPPNEAQTVSGYFRPQKGSTFAALAVHHIADSDLRDDPPSSSAKLPADAAYIIGHNVDYDWKALGSPAGVKRICTLAISRTLCPDDEGHSLGAMIYRYHDPVFAAELLRDAHSAVADVDLCERLLMHLLDAAEIEPASFEELWLYSEKCRIPFLMPFGKHRGQPIGGMPRDYKNWCLKQPDFDPYVLQAIRNSL